MPLKYRFEHFLAFNSRRSPVVARGGVVAASEHLAAQAGLEIFRSGGNAADAAVATAAALNVTEPMMTGLGGDVFAIFYEASTRRVHGVNGSGRSPAELTLELAQNAAKGRDALPENSALAVTVPGAAAAWADVVARHGQLSLARVLAPAIRMAEEGFPVSPLNAVAWASGVSKLRRSPVGRDLLVAGKRAPEPGEVFQNPRLAAAMRTLAEDGKEGFYSGWPGRSIVKAVLERGGVLSMDDLAAHETTFEDPVSTTYRGVTVHEMPPNGQGVVALEALNLLEGFDAGGLDPLGAEFFHVAIECVRLAFADARRHVADPLHARVPLAGLISKEYAARRRRLVDPNRAAASIGAGDPRGFGAADDTVYLAAVDREGNACSFINSNYAAFGTGIVPEGCGFVLQNRGCNFSLEPGHPNAVAPYKRPYHTIIPALATVGGELFAAFGVMGGFMQPQGHVQVLSRLVDHEFDPQAALDAPRFYVVGGDPNGPVALEESVPPATRDRLAAMGHRTKVVGGMARQVFGRGQVILRNPEGDVFWAGSDPRSDGCALGLP
ncbi:MAG: gamma-glutamyltransferase [Promethearchaeota archaeon]